MEEKKKHNPKYTFQKWLAGEFYIAGAEVPFIDDVNVPAVQWQGLSGNTKSAILKEQNKIREQVSNEKLKTLIQNFDKIFASSLDKLEYFKNEILDVSDLLQNPNVIWWNSVHLHNTQFPFIDTQFHLFQDFYKKHILKGEKILDLPIYQNVLRNKMRGIESCIMATAFADYFKFLKGRYNELKKTTKDLQSKGQRKYSEEFICVYTHLRGFKISKGYLPDEIKEELGIEYQPGLYSRFKRYSDPKYLSYKCDDFELRDLKKRIALFQKLIGQFKLLGNSVLLTKLHNEFEIYKMNVEHFLENNQVSKIKEIEAVLKIGLG